MSMQQAQASLFKKKSDATGYVFGMYILTAVPVTLFLLLADTI